jgi:hypothetical protein
LGWRKWAGGVVIVLSVLLVFGYLAPEQFQALLSGPFALIPSLGG